MLTMLGKSYILDYQVFASTKLSSILTVKLGSVFSSVSI